MAGSTGSADAGRLVTITEAARELMTTPWHLQNRIRNARRSGKPVPAAAGESAYGRPRYRLGEMREFLLRKSPKQRKGKSHGLEVPDRG